MRRPYLVRIDGLLRHTHYTPQQTRDARAMMQQGYPLEAIAARLHIPYSSVHYVAFMERLTHDALEDHDAPDA